MTDHLGKIDERVFIQELPFDERILETIKAKEYFVPTIVEETVFIDGKEYKLYTIKLEPSEYG